jgi:hypothetical protein
MVGVRFGRGRIRFGFARRFVVRRLIMTGRVGFIALLASVERLRLYTIDGKGWFQEGLL